MNPILKIFVILFAGLVMVSCNQKQIKQQQDAIAQLNNENETLRQQALENETNMKEFFESMSQIRDNLSEIKVRQNLISKETGGKDQVGQDVRKQISEDLAIIGKLMDDNRRRMASLNRQLRDSNLKNEELEKLIANLTLEIEQRNIEIASLRENMNLLNIHNEALSEAVDNLEKESSERQTVIKEKTEQLNTAYFVYGTRRQLLDHKIINREGGILGLGRTSVVNSQVSKDHFTRIDISRVESIEIPGNKLNLVSVHPDDSYSVKNINDQVSQIVIEDQGKFWSNTRYLVVSLE